jgi:hypothetical protein
MALSHHSGLHAAEERRRRKPGPSGQKPAGEVVRGLRGRLTAAPRRRKFSDVSCPLGDA